MPTGYTAYIEDGKITTGKGFLKLCVRAFAVCKDQRDDPLDAELVTHFDADESYQKKYEQAQQELEAFKALSMEEVKAEYIQRQRENIEMHQKWIEDYRKLRALYLPIRQQIEAWVPPLEDQNQLKEFALHQIDMCIPTEDSISKLSVAANQPIIDDDASVEHYRETTIRHLTNGVQNAKEMMEKDILNAIYRNNYMKTLLESLEAMS